MEAATLPNRPTPQFVAAAPRDPDALMFGLFADQEEVIDTGLVFVALLGLFLSTGFGPICVLAYLGCVSLLFIRAPWAAFNGLISAWAILLMPIVAVASVAWSIIPSETLRAGVQLLLTFVGAVIIANRVNQRQFVAALMLATLLTSLGCLASPRVHVGPEGTALVGLMGSKNQMSFLAGTLVLTSLAILLDPKHLKLIRLACIGTMFLGAGLVLASISAGGLIGVAAGGAILCAGAVLSRMRFLARCFVLMAMLIIATPAVVMAPTLQDASEDFIVNVLHKDTTLTGRTYLWDRGLSISRERPILGIGYHAFWVQGQPDAEGLWAYSGIKARAGFNFHNQFVDLLVTLGWFGVVTFAIGLISTVLGVSLEALLAPSVAGAFFLANTIINVIRAFTESTLVVEFNFYTLIFFAGGVLAWREMRKADFHGHRSSKRGNPRPPRPGVERNRAVPTRMTRRAARF